MTPAQLAKLMHDAKLSQLDMANLFNRTTRQVRRWQKGEADTPMAEAVLLLMLQQGSITTEQIEQLKAKARVAKAAKK